MNDHTSQTSTAVDPLHGVSDEVRQAVGWLLELRDDLDPGDYLAHKHNLFGGYAWAKAAITGRPVEPVDHGPDCADCARKPQDTRRPVTDVEAAAHPYTADVATVRGDVRVVWRCGCGAEGVVGETGWFEHVHAQRTH